VQASKTCTEKNELKKCEKIRKKCEKSLKFFNFEPFFTKNEKLINSSENECKLIKIEDSRKNNILTEFFAFKRKNYISGFKKVTNGTHKPKYFMHDSEIKFNETTCEIRLKNE